MPWFKATRRFVCAQEVYVRADSREAAESRMEAADFDGETEPSIERYYAEPKPKRIDGIPRWLWEELGCPDDAVILEAK